MTSLLTSEKEVLIIGTILTSPLVFKLEVMFGHFRIQAKSTTTIKTPVTAFKAEEEHKVYSNFKKLRRSLKFTSAEFK